MYLLKEVIQIPVQPQSHLKLFLQLSGVLSWRYNLTVHSGTYREWINPIRGGESDRKELYTGQLQEKRLRSRDLRP